MGEPLPVTGLLGGSYAAAVHIGEISGETGIPFPPAFRVLTIQAVRILDGVTETGGTKHSTVSACQTALRHLVPVGMVEFLVKNGL